MALMLENLVTVNESDKNNETRSSILLVGPPNVGKSVIFNSLSGKYLTTVSNYPGTTVEVTKTKLKFQSTEYYLVDTPGINSLLPMSDDEAITLRMMFQEQIKHIILIGDSKNLLRTLNLFYQISLLGFPIVLVLNMHDELTKSGLSINSELLSGLLGVPVLSTVAIENIGLNNIFEVEPKKPLFKLNFPDFIENTISDLSDEIPDIGTLDKRGIAIQLLRADPVTCDLVKNSSDENVLNNVNNAVNEINSKFHLGLNYLLIDTINDFAKQITDKVLKRSEPKKAINKWNLDNLTINPVTGFPLLLLVLIGIFLLVGYLGAGILVDFIENEIFNNIINPIFVNLVESYIPIEIVKEILIGKFGIVTLGLTYALGVILPIVAIFFLIFSFLEDTGYLPRIAVLLNSSFNRIGLNGKAVLPLLLGTGCVTMATLSTRILESRKERLIATTVLAVGIPCSAQLGVILGILSFISLSSFVLVFFIVILQIIIVSYLLSKIIPGERSEFLIELPPLRTPKFSNVTLKTISRIESFVKEAVPIFVIGIFFINILNMLGMVDWIIESFEPIVELLLGLPKETSLIFIFGFIRRDFGAAGLFDLIQSNLLTANQLVIVAIVLLLFIPCIANFFMIAKEYGSKIAFSVLFFVIPYALLIGTLVNFVLITFGVVLT
jgi:ferrous iron transport protein B